MGTLAAVMVPLSVHAGSVTIEWKANSEADLAGYNVYYGTSSRKYGPPIPVGKRTEFTIDRLQTGRTYYVALTALDNAGNESGFSREIRIAAEEEAPAPAPKKPAPEPVNDNRYVSLPSNRPLGYMREGDRSHFKRVKFRFERMPGEGILRYRVYDINRPNRIRIVLNGHVVGHAPVTKRNAWGQRVTVRLPDAFLRDAKPNKLVFKHLRSSSKRPRFWAVDDVAVTWVAPQGKDTVPPPGDSGSDRK
jgi:hypothetical protein